MRTPPMRKEPSSPDTPKPLILVLRLIKISQEFRKRRKGFFLVRPVHQVLPLQGPPPFTKVVQGTGSQAFEMRIWSILKKRSSYSFVCLRMG